MSSRPDDGDIIIRHEQRRGQGVFLLRAVPGPDQYMLRTRDAAMTQAVAFAKRQRVRVWMMDGGETFTLLNDFRQRRKIAAEAMEAR